MECNKILIAVDSSDFSFKTALKGANLAKKFKSEIGLVLVIEPVKSVISPEVGYMATEFIDQSKQESDKILDNIIEAIQKNNRTKFEITKFLPTGSPSQQIIQTAEDWSADLIIVGTHGRTGLMSILMGSVAQSVVQYSKTPVMVFPAKSLEESVSPDKK